MTEMLCRDCDAIVLFVTPDCDEQDCGDLMCVVCGAAVSVGGLLVAEPTSRPARRTAAA